MACTGLKPKKALEEHPVLSGLVETSNNLAAVKPEADGASYKIVMSSRSSIGSALQSQRDVIARVARVVGAGIAQDNAYPGQPSLHASVL